MTITDSSDGPPEAVKAELLKLNVAEYQALMSRANQFMSFQLGVWGSTIAFITLVVNQWRETKPHDPAIVWLGGIGVQILLHLASTLVEQQDLLVTYIENNLRHSVVGALPQNGRRRAFGGMSPFSSASGQMLEQTRGVSGLSPFRLGCCLSAQRFNGGRPAEERTLWCSST